MTTVHIGRGCRRCAWRGWRLQVGPLGWDIMPCRHCRPRRVPHWAYAVLFVLAFAALCGIGARCP